MKMIEGGVTAAKGFVAGGIHCGIRKNKTKPDLAMIYSGRPCAAAAVYTRNLVKGAPILVTKKNLENGFAQAVICNSGNANTCNADGVEKAQAMCDLAAQALGISPQDVVVASTGVIGQVLPIEPIAQGVPALAKSLSPEGSLGAATAIMTTDTLPKEAAAQVELGGKAVKVGGISKGSGMIHPNMATMLCFVTTDCAISPAMLQKAIHQVTDATFNMISIDGDTSTNDTFAILANGAAGNPEITQEGPEYEAFVGALEAVCRTLSKKMAGDGEGATKLLISQVEGAPDEGTAQNGGQKRHLLHPVQGGHVWRRRQLGPGCCAPSATPAPRWTWTRSMSASVRPRARWTCAKRGRASPSLRRRPAWCWGRGEIEILIHLHMGDASAEAYGCDLTYDYVKINGDYRT